MQDHQPIPGARLREYAARESRNPGLGSFEGGATANGVWIGLAVVCILVIAIYTLFIEPGKVKPGS